jgi:hypothetical protein
MSLFAFGCLLVAGTALAVFWRGIIAAANEYERVHFPEDGELLGDQIRAAINREIPR